MRWQGGWDASWERHFRAAEAYYEEHGDLLVGAREEYGGVALGRWVAQLRASRKRPGGNGCLTPERARALERIGMVWDVPAYLWERNYASAERYYREHGDLDVPGDYVDGDGVPLGKWVAKLRREVGQERAAGQEEEERHARLDAIGMAWEPKRESAWERNYAEAEAYYREHGDLSVPALYTTAGGARLGRWVRCQRESFRKGSLSLERKGKLDQIGMVWERKHSSESI